MYKNRRNIWNKIGSKARQIAVLLDPEKITLDLSFEAHLKTIESSSISFIFVGGSTVSHEQQRACVSFLKQHCALPLVIFPGSPDQIVEDADAILLLNLISGRNPDFLIGHHVDAAQRLHDSKLEIIPTAYILVDGGTETSVQRISKTRAIGHDEFDLFKRTAIAGSLMGNQLIYLDAGSGAKKSVPHEWVSAVKADSNIPLIVGGGIRDIDSIERYFNSGADLVVIGNHIESNPSFLSDLGKLILHRY